jgi:hypothetical protein
MAKQSVAPRGARWAGLDNFARPASREDQPGRIGEKVAASAAARPKKSRTRTHGACGKMSDSVGSPESLPTGDGTLADIGCKRPQIPMSGLS